MRLPGDEAIRRDVVNEVAVEQAGQETEQAHRAEEEGRDHAHRRPRAARGQPREAELCRPDREGHRVVGLEAPRLVSRVCAC